MNPDNTLTNRLLQVPSANDKPLLNESLNNPSPNTTFNQHRKISKTHESVLFRNKFRNSSFQYSVLPEKEEHAPHLMITDLAMHFDEIAELDQNNMETQIRNYTAVDMWILLILLAIIVPIISQTFSLCSGKFLTNVMHYFIEENTFGYFIACLMVSLACAFTSCTICYYNRDAEGSGIPELKSTLAGISIYKYLSINTLIAKILGLFLP